MDWERWGWGWGWVTQNKEGGPISAGKKWNQIRMKSIWQKLCISGNYFLHRREVISRDCLGVKMSNGGRGLQSEVSEIWSLVSIPEPNTVHPLWLARLVPHYQPILTSIWGENAALQSHFRGTLITRATHLNWRKIALPPLSLCLSMSPTALSWRQTEMRNPLCFLLRKVEVWVGEMEGSFKRHM